MTAFAVQSGDLFQCVDADNHLNACIKALQMDWSEERSGLGRIMGCLMCGDTRKDEVFVLTEKVIKAAGFEFRVDGPPSAV